MGEKKAVYYIYLKNGKYDLLKILFYWTDVEYYKEDGDKIIEAFKQKYWGTEFEVVNIEKDEKLSEELFEIII